MLRTLTASRSLKVKATRLCLLLAFATLVVGSVDAQTSSATEGHTPSGLSPGSPAGSYALSGFDTINPYNGGLNFSLPLLNLGGRGGATYTMPLQVEQKWTALHDVIIDPETQQQWDFLWPEYNWWTGFKPGYSPGIMLGRQAGYLSQTCMTGGTWSTYFYTLTRLSFITPDGTEFELRDQLTGGQVSTVPICTPEGANGASRGTTFVTADGTAATFVSDTATYDSVTIGGQGIIYPSGFLMLRDGTRYRIDEGQVTWMRDRNGNKLAFVYSGSAVTSITDSLNRQITIEYDVQDVAPYGLCDRITFKGFGGASRIIRVAKTALGNALRSGYSLQSSLSLFPELFSGSSGDHNPTVFSAVYLPDNDGVIRRYQFWYNSYGELARVELPTGGAFEYDWAVGATGGAASGVICELSNDMHIYRRIIERRVYPDGGSGSTFASRMTYSRPEHRTANCSYSNQGFVEVSQFNNGGVLQTRTRHYFFGSPTDSLIDSHNPTTYPAWDEGREYQTEIFDANGTTILRRMQHTWQGNGTMGGLTVNPRIIQTTTAFEPSAANQVAKQIFAHDQYNNETDLYEYDFGTGGPGPLVRRTHTDYLTTNDVTGVNYATTNSIHVRNLPTQISRYDSLGVEKARTTFEYDNYAIDSNHAALLDRTSISGFDSTFTTSYVTRGNATATTSHLLVGGSSVSVYAQFDIAGNVIKMIDGRGYPTTIQYDDHFGPPNGNAHLNSPPFELSSAGQASFAFATRVTNSLGHISYAKFDYHTGRVVDGEDANGVVSSGYSDDEPLDRPTKIIRAVNTSVQNQTVFSYDDVARIITTSSDLNSSGDGVLVSKMLYDGLGRTLERRQYEGSANYIVVMQEYDALGRPFKTSNPFRPWQSQTAVWTTQLFDALGRVTSVTTPDNAVVSTSYSGNSVTVTDQTGKARRSVTDAPGRLVEVYEDPNGVNYQTTYLYDVLDNLVKVTQGSQQRFFMYDSLKHLIRARNPEQGTLASLSLSDPITGNSGWSIGYEYDSNGNLIKKTDASGVESTYVYDALNRSTNVNYSDATPDVGRQYDLATNGKGRINQVWQSGPTTSATYIDSYDALGRPLVQRQRFETDGVWSDSYQTSREYNRAGGVTLQTYPSQHWVRYNYDQAGRLADKDAVNLAFTGNLGDGVQRTYSTGITYSQWGSLSREQFGTSSAVYNKRHYNIRGQLCDVRASNVDQEWSGELGVLVNYYSTAWAHCGSGTDNNGNVLMSQTIINSYYMEDRYSYDALNRLTAVNEWQNGSNYTGSQQYNYDRWGNRTIKDTSWGVGINTKQFTVDATTNRLGVPGGESGVMTYDFAGNLITDTYTGAGLREYDAENRMTRAWGGDNQSQYYTYNADGQRVRRKVDGQETWQIYGFDGELLAEYAAHASSTSPQKEYGYRNGQLLITVAGNSSGGPPTSGLAGSWKLDENSGTTAADSSGNNNTGTLAAGATWTTGQSGAATSLDGADDYVQVGAQSSLVMTSAASFSAWIYPTGAGSMPTFGGIIVNKEGEYEIARFADGTIQWAFANTNPGWNWINTGYVAPLNQWTHVAVTYDSGVVKTYINGALIHTYSGSGAIGDVSVAENDFRIGGRQVASHHFHGRIDEVRVYNRALSAAEVPTLPNGSGSSSVEINWLVADHLGTPRMIIDQTGSLANIKRHDYLPFGEELFAGVGGRASENGYAGGDSVRQQFTRKERDNETGLDYFGARYYASMQGRFTGADPYDINFERQMTVDPDEADDLFRNYIKQPQHWNRYVYALNNPLKYVDPDGQLEYETELLGKKIKVKISDKIEKNEQDTIKKNLDAAIAKINQGADKLTSDQIRAINSMKGIEVRNDVRGSFMNLNNKVFNMKQSFAENPNLDFLVAGIIHDSFHADQARRGLSFDGDENGRNREKEASAFALDVAQRIGLSNQVIEAYKRDARGRSSRTTR